MFELSLGSDPALSPQLGQDIFYGMHPVFDTAFQKPDSNITGHNPRMRLDRGEDVFPTWDPVVRYTAWHSTPLWQHKAPDSQCCGNPGLWLSYFSSASRCSFRH